jgi:MYXO-CTERM domain-containing protein
MRKLFPCLALSLLLPASTAWAQAADGGTNPDAADPDSGVEDAGAADTGAADTGAPDAGGGCGPITLEGECQGSEVVYCNEGVVERIDCATEYDPPAMCGEVDPSYGVDCLLAQGEGCLFIDENGDYVQSFCQGPGAGCVETPNEVTCEANLGACVEADIDRCVGNRLMTDCLINQPYFIDCAEYGGICSEGACRQVPAGSFCDPSLILCDDNSECRPGTLDPDFYQCVARSAPDAGTADGDAGVVADSGTNAPAPEEDSGCRATGAGRGGWWPALAMLLVFLGRRRR